MPAIENTFTATGTGANKLGSEQPTTVYTSWARLTGTGAVTATVVVEITNDPAGAAGWIAAQTLTLSGTDEAFDGITNIMAPTHTRHRVSAITGTNASVQVVTRAG